MDEKRITRITADLMFTITNHSGTSKESWLELYAAACAVKQIIERSPTVHIKNITPEESNLAEAYGLKIGKLTADAADIATKNYRN